MRDVGRNDVDGAGGEEVFLSADAHFQLAFYDVGDLFVNVMVQGGDAAFFYLPKDEGGGVAMNHSAIETRKRILYWDIIEVLHGQIFPKVRQKCG